MSVCAFLSLSHPQPFRFPSACCMLNMLVSSAWTFCTTYSLNISVLTLHTALRVLFLWCLFLFALSGLCMFSLHAEHICCEMLMVDVLSLPGWWWKTIANHTDIMRTREPVHCFQWENVLFKYSWLQMLLISRLHANVVAYAVLKDSGLLASIKGRGLQYKAHLTCGTVTGDGHLLNWFKTKTKDYENNIVQFSMFVYTVSLTLIPISLCGHFLWKNNKQKRSSCTILPSSESPSLHSIVLLFLSIAMFVAFSISNHSRTYVI